VNVKPEGDASPSGFLRAVERRMRRRSGVTQTSCARHFAERNCGETKNASQNTRPLRALPKPFHVDRGACRGEVVRPQ
jgi:hypothetical protein